jgi:hypothetical protein
MKAAVLLVIIKFLVDQGHCEDITLSLSDGTIRWMWTENQTKLLHKVELCLFNSTCYKSVMPIILSKVTINTMPCSNCTTNDCGDGTIKWMRTQHQKEYEIELCLFNLTCYKSDMPITFKRALPSNENKITGSHYKSYDILETIPIIDNYTCSQFATSTQECSDSNNNPSTDLRQYILIALIALLAALLAIVTAGWVCTCWAMRKSRRREMNISTTNIR